MKSIVDHLETWASTQPEKTAFAFLDLHGDELDRYTYRRLNLRSRAVAFHLVRLGLKRGDRVLLVYPPGLDFIVAFLSCARIGVIPVPVPPARINSVASDCDAKAVLSTRMLTHLRGSAPLEWIATDEIDGAALEALADDPGEVLFLQYTSGSTGDPRGVVVSHRNVLCNAAGTVGDVPITVSWLPHFHDMGLIGYQLFPLIAGGTSYGFSPLHFLKRPALWLQTISRVRATRTSSPNFGFEYCLRPGKLPTEQLHGIDLSSLRVLMNAAEPVCTETYRRFVERLAPYGLDPDAATVAYGLAENTLAVTHGGRRAISIHSQLLAKSIARPTRSGSSLMVKIHSCGTPVDGVRVRIVDPDTRRSMPDGSIGEIWVGGSSVCEGYWQRPAATKEVFRNALSGDEESGDHLRTGDLGFLDDGELFVCGRIRDIIIVRGANHYPQDIEAAALSASPQLRPNGVAAFPGVGDESLVLVAEVRDPNSLPNPDEIARAVRTRCFVEPDVIVLVPPRTIARTTSGKLARQATRERYLEEGLPVLLERRAQTPWEPCARGGSMRERFDYIRSLGDPSADPKATFADLGVDSLLLTRFLTDLETALGEEGAGELCDEIDLSLLQRLPVEEFFAMLDELVEPSQAVIAACRARLRQLRSAFDDLTDTRMRADSMLDARDPGTIELPDEPLTKVLLTGPTGFFGPFLLHALLSATPYSYYALTRAADPGAGMRRIREALQGADLLSPSVDAALTSRVQVVCGDIAKPDLGLAAEQWSRLSRELHAVMHNAALVNYVLNYDALKPANVDGTRSLLRFAHTGRRKEFHLVSSTFIFGWTVQGVVEEDDANAEMRNLDFGYSQTKWVAEQLVHSAAKHGLKVQIYRPSLISASTHGHGDDSDVLIRLLSFMINHGIAVDSKNQVSILPADVAAANIAAIFRERNGLGRTFHVTADRYYSLTDLTRLIGRKYGYPITHYDIPTFIAKMNQRCKVHDPLYPLLDFFNRSASKIAAMQLKRYRNDAYRAARDSSGIGRPDPTLEETASYLVTHMLRKGLIRRSPAHS